MSLDKKNSDQAQPEETASEETRQQDSAGGETKAKVRTLVRLKKKVMISEQQGEYIDDRIVSSQYYNNFNYALLPQENAEGKLVIGVTSASPGDGKTLVASNLAASFAMAHRRETVLIDLNIGRPRLHDIFGMQLSPGILDAFFEPSIWVTETKLANLSVLTAGDLSSSPLSGMLFRSGNGNAGENVDISNFGLRLEQLPEFRNVIYSLLELYDFIIVDLPSMKDEMVPPLFMNHLDGVIIVVTAGVTKQEDIDKIVSQLDEQRILGFVLNRTE